MSGVDLRGVADQGDAARPRSQDAPQAAYLELAVGFAADIVLMQDAHGRCVWVSPSCPDVMGWPVEDVVGRHAADFLHPDDLPAYERARGVAADTGRSDVEYRMRHGDGTYHWVQARRRQLSVEGSDVATVVILRVVDDAVATRQALEDSQARLQLIADHSRDAIVLARGRALAWASPAIGELTGVPADEVVGRPFAQFFHPDDQAAVDVARAELDAGRDTNLRVRLRHLDGTWHWVDIRASAITDAAGETDLRVGNLRLVDDEVAASALLRAQQEALAESERRYRLVVSNSRDAITVTDAGVLRWASPAIRDILGVSPEDLVGSQLLDHIHPEDHSALEAVRAQLIAGRSTRAPIQTRVRHRDGSWHWIAMHVGPFVDDEGQVAGAVANWHLIDDQVAYLEALTRSEARNRELAAQLQQALESRVVIEQAKGMIAAQRDVSVDEAFELLRTHARARGARIHDVANAVVTLGLRL